MTKRYLSLETTNVLSDDPNVMPPALAAAWSAVSVADHARTAALLHHVQDTTVQRVTPNQNCKLKNTILSPVRRKLKPLSSYAKNPDRRAISQCRQLVRPFGQPTQTHDANAWGDDRTIWRGWSGFILMEDLSGLAFAYFYAFE